MGYGGGIYSVPCDTGGFNANPNIDFIPPNSLVEGSRNINLHQSGRLKRGGTSKVLTSAVTGNPSIMGIFDFRLPTTSFQVFGTSDGKIYKNGSTSIKSGLGSSKYSSFCVFGSELFACNGYDTPQTWNGTAGSTSNITTPAADWTGTTQPFQMIPHGRGASRRLWALMGNAVYYSTLGNGKEFSGGTSGKITIETNDGVGLVGGIEFGDRLIVFSRTQAFIIDDQSSDVADWGYQASIFQGGAAHWRVVCRTPNDVVAMTDDGDIYSFSAVQEYGDYKQASIVRPAFIDRWIKENLDLPEIAKFHAVYDPNLRAVKFFVVRKGESYVDSALVYFIDRGPVDGWMLHDNLTAASGYDAAASATVRVGAGEYAVYTGDYSGMVWRLETDDANDDGAGYRASIVTPFLAFDNIRNKKSARLGTLNIFSDTPVDLEIGVSVEDAAARTISLSYGGTTALYGSAIYGASTFAATSIGRQNFDIGEKGKYFQFSIENATADQKMFMGSFFIEFTPLGVPPE